MADPLAVTSLGPNRLGGLPVQQVANRAPHVNGLVYGDSGVGKTRLLGTCDNVPEMRKVLLLDCEGGAFSIRNTNPNVEVVRFQSWMELQAIAIDLVEGGQYKEYGTICLDSGTEAQNANFGHVTNIGVEKKEEHDRDLMQMQDWGRSLIQMRRMVRLFRDLPVNFMMTALAKDAKVDAVRTKKGPEFSGKFQAEVTALMDVVMYMYTRNVDGVDKRLLLTKTTENVIAKDRSDALPTVIDTPDMKFIYPLLTSAKKKVTTK